MVLRRMQKFFLKIVSATIAAFIILFLSPLIFVIQGVFMLKGYYDKLSTERIKWAPLDVPIHRRLETIAAGVMVYYGFLLIPTFIFINLVLLYNLNNFWRIFLIIYWIYNYYDHYENFSVFDGIGSKLIRTFAVGQYARNYFPVELIKTTELKPNKNYIIACFPHGVMSYGPIMNFAFDIRKWLELFPGIRPKMATLDISFCVPILRHYMQIYGFIAISKESLLYYLRKSNDYYHIDNQDGFTSYAIGLSIGGAKEASETKPGCYKLILKNRKGFVKIAIQTGANIVPSFTFNEVDTYEQIFTTPGSLGYRFQALVKKFTGIWISKIVGRGFFQYNIGLLPQRRRLVQVVGAPIDVRKCDVPDSAYVDEIHQKVVLAVQELFETYKEKYLENYKDATLLIT